MAYLSLKATLLTEDIFIPLPYNRQMALSTKISQNYSYPNSRRTHCTIQRAYVKKKGKKMVIYERVSLFILLVLRCAWPLGDITAVESCMRWRLTDNEHLDLTFCQRLYSTSFGRLPKELDVARIV